jgi:cell division protein FtsW
MTAAAVTVAERPGRLRVRSTDRSDPWILGMTLLFVAAGVLFVFDTTYFFSQTHFGDGYRMITKHAASILLGGLLLWVCYRVRSDQLQRWARPIFVAGVCFLAVPLIPGVGFCNKGACRWVNVGPLNIQPAELVKVAFVLSVAALLTRKGSDVRRFRDAFLPTLALMGVVAGLLLAQPDLGSVALIGLLGISMMFLAGVPLYQLVLLVAPVVAAGYFLVLNVPWRLQRILCFTDAWADPKGACYQLVQSYRTFGSGGVEGIGVGASLQKTGWLPEAHTDFILAVIGEEAGLLGSVLVVLAFAVLAYRGFRVAHRHPDSFGQLLAAGLTLTLTYQALVNMGVVLGLLPTKGLVLPFISYGGSAMLMALASIGILMSLSRELRGR